MIVLRVVLFALGLGIVLFVLLSAIRSFVLPRPTADTLPRWVFFTMRRLFELGLKRRNTYEQRDRLMALYAPISLLVLPVVWIICVVCGYTVMYAALGVQPLTAAFILSGSSLLTLGFAPASTLTAIILVFSEATIGLALVALLIAFLPTIYSAFSKREELVSLLEVRAGSPPSAVTLLTRFHQLERLDKLTELWVDWEVWFVAVEESHTSLAALAFFRSPNPDRNWVTAAGAVLDAAALMTAALDLPRVPERELCLRAGFLALRSIATLYRIPIDPDPQPDDFINITRREFDDACDALQVAGIPLKADREGAWRAFAGWRVNYDVALLALADLVMAPVAPWSSDRSPRQRALPWLRHSA